MYNFAKSFVDGHWASGKSDLLLAVINPGNNQQVGAIGMAELADVNVAVLSARKAFESFSTKSKAERIALLQRIIKVYKARMPELAEIVSKEMGAPLWLAEGAQVNSGLAHLEQALNSLQELALESPLGDCTLRHEAVGVCALITPWNWPLNQVTCKVGPALAMGCTMILKPSEIAPLSACLFAEILQEAGVPEGVFNLINGDGKVGAALSTHPDVDMVSFTGSTRAGIAVAKAAADTVKRVSQELGGKSANILLPDLNMDEAIPEAVKTCMHNSGQSCNAPTRLFVPRDTLAMCLRLARETAGQLKVGLQDDPDVFVGPVVSDLQYQRIQEMINIGIDEGAELIAGGPGKPKDLKEGCFVRPTIFAVENNQYRIAREEIFGPVLTIIPYDTIEHAVAMANDSEYGLSAYISSGDREQALSIARQLRTGMVHINGAWTDPIAPFGGYKQSGNGREWGVYGLHEFSEVKAIMG